MRMHLPLASVPLNMRLVVRVLEDSPAPEWNGGPGQEGRSTRRRTPATQSFLCWDTGESVRAIQTLPEGANMPQMEVPKVRTGCAGR